MSDNKKKEINIELDQETAQGTYSNLAIINHSVSCRFYQCNARLS
jgi:hypothetical protein